MCSCCWCWFLNIFQHYSTIFFSFFFKLVVFDSRGAIYHVLYCTKINALYQLLSRHCQGWTSSLCRFGYCLQSRMPKTGSSCHCKSSNKSNHFYHLFLPSVSFSLYPSLPLCIVFWLDGISIPILILLFSLSSSASFSHFPLAKKYTEKMRQKQSQKKNFFQRGTLLVSKVNEEII